MCNALPWQCQCVAGGRTPDFLSALPVFILLLYCLLLVFLSDPKDKPEPGPVESGLQAYPGPSSPGRLAQVGRLPP